MKSVKLFFSLLFIVTLFSCSKKNDKEIDKSDDPIVGTWKLVHVIYSATVDNDHGRITYTGGASNPRGNLIFQNDHKILGDAAITVNCGIELSGGQAYTISHPNQKIISGEGTWSIDNRQLIIEVAGENPVTYDYVIHSGNELDMERVYPEIVNGQTATIDLILLFEKQ